MTKYKVGDIVRITKDVDNLMDFGICRYDAEIIAGTMQEIVAISGNLYEINTNEERGCTTNWWVNEGQIVHCHEQILSNEPQCYIFYYKTVINGDYTLSSEQKCVIANSQKEANERFYNWLVKNVEFVEVIVNCECVEIVKENV